MSLSKDTQGSAKMKRLRVTFSRKQLCIPYGLFLVLFVVLPLILIAFYAFTDQNGTISVANFIRFFSSATTLSTLLISILLALATTLICIIIAYPIAYILANSKQVSGKEDIARVASVSAANEYIGNLIADAMEKVSKDGVITIEESKTSFTEVDVVEGMQFDKGYVSPYMVTDTEKMEAVLDNPYMSMPL